jgi:AraC-like DNA-binding protein
VAPPDYEARWRERWEAEGVLARRLMLGEGLDAAEATFRVGSESPSQFSREYRRLFGARPRQDVAGLKIDTQPTT